MALQQAATTCEEEERRFRREAQRRIDELARARIEAYRRLHVLKSMVEAARPIAEREASIGAQLRRVAQLTGWSEADGGWHDFRSALADVAAVVHLDVHPVDGNERPDGHPVIEAFLSFERWYQGHFGAPFLDLLEREPSFQPAVDF